ncbi:MAG TPA: AsmA-like C-terminal domain-containing protein [Sulfurovum sp.]|nr:AsmA-like C-terminal domain-containing protein [Sulfurovum sp.]
MIKTSAKFPAHAINVFLRNTLILLFVLLVAFFIWLFAGIKLETVKIADYHVAGLYIKLNKKLTLQADHITIPQSKADPSFYNVQETLEGINYILTFFDYIELKNLVFKNNRMKIVFDKNYLLIDSKDYRISGNVINEENILKADIPILNIKEHDLTMSGKFTYDLHKDILHTKGQFLLNDIPGEFNATKERSEIDFALKSSRFTDLKPVIDKFDLVDTVRSWVLDKVKAKSYTLLSLSGKGNIINKKFKMDLDALKGEALFSEAEIHFKENLEPVLAPSFILTYKDGGLYFDLESPTYEGISLEGSEVSILNLRDPDTNLKLKIMTHTRFGTEMQHLLQAYALDLPLNQTSGKVNVLFTADLGLKNLYQDFFVNVDFDKGDIWLNRLKLPIEKGNLQYKEGWITLKEIYLKDVNYQGMLNGKIDIQKKKADLILDAERIALGDEKENFFVLKNETLPFTVAYKEKIEVSIPKLYAKFTNDRNETNIHLTDLNKIKPYLADPGPLEEGGYVDIKTKDFKTYTFNGVMKRSSCFLFEKDNECKARVPFEGKVTADNLHFYVFDKRFDYNRAKSRVKITDLNVDLEKFLRSIKSSKEKSSKESAKKKKPKEKPLVILGKNSQLRYEKYSLVTDSYDVEVRSNGDIKAIGSSFEDIVKFSKTGNILSMQALRVQDKVLHPLINFKGLQDGRYTLKLSGNPEETMKGEIIVEGGVMKDFKAYNNTLAFINTLPTLAVLQNPGYSSEGFTIEEGIAEYRMIKQDKILFDSIYIKGTSATIAGTGEIDLNQKTIRLDLAIQTARELGKLVGSLPLVGYIITGGDKSMTFGLQITGSLEKPEVKTSATKDLLELPLRILQRALEAPKKAIDQ